MEEDLLSITEIVKKYGVSRKTVQRRVDSEELVPFKTLSGRTGAHLFKAEDAERVIGPIKPRKRRSETEPAEV